MAMKIKHWQDPVSLILGLWLLISPWALQYQGEVNPRWNAVVVGIVVAAIALYAMFQVMAWQEWVNAALGIWLVISPWALGFAGLAAAMWNAVIVGAVIAVLAVWALSTDRDIGGWWSPAT
jgi:hypothetical protein